MTFLTVNLSHLFHIFILLIFLHFLFFLISCIIFNMILSFYYCFQYTWMMWMQWCIVLLLTFYFDGVLDYVYFFRGKLLCSVMLCYVMSCYVMLWHVMLCYDMLCYVMLCYDIPYYNIPQHNTLLNHITWHNRRQFYFLILIAVVVESQEPFNSTNEFLFKRK